VAAKAKDWARANPDRAKTNAYANCARRYANKRSRTPPWLSADQRAEILAIYRECRERRRLGEDLHVDHVIPLVGRDVSGLHVPWNLQIVPASYNVRKSNRLVA
jgi:5-methylcytosine-specific restriction endonuclease McrA